MIIATIVSILQLLEPGISGNKSNTATILPQHFHFGKGKEKKMCLTQDSLTN